MKNSILLGLCVPMFLLSSLAMADGNRYDKERRYHSEIGVSEAFVLTHYNRGNVSGSEFRNAVLIDVRSIPEYVAGHPANAVNIPYPRIHPTIDSTLNAAEKASLFVEAVMAAYPDKNTPILLLCRTGSRSVDAGNLLADAGYTHVRNIWEGFIGMPKVDTKGNLLDLNNNGIIGDEGDLDGWKNYAGLPYSTRLLPQLIYQPLSYLYY